MSSLEPILWERLSLHSHWRVPTSRGSQQAAAVPERPLESQGSQRCPCPRYHRPPQGPNEARPQVLPPQFFTLYYALLESMSHCLGRAARSLPSQELNFQCVQWPHSYILESISTCSLHVILKAKKHAHSWYSVFLVWNFGLHIGPYIFINLLIQRTGNLRTILCLGSSLSIKTFWTFLHKSLGMGNRLLLLLLSRFSRIRLCVTP